MSLLDEPWDEKFKQMMKYKETNGHLIFLKTDISNQQLARWIRKQRQSKKKGRLTQCRIDKLDSVNFEWDARERTWNESFHDYEEFVKTNGISGVPMPKSHLSHWMSNQRRAYKNGSLKPSRVELLDNMGFCWGLLKGDAEPSPSSAGAGVAPAVAAPAVGASVPVDYYVEDIAWRENAVHTADVSNLSPLPPPAPLPPLISDNEDTSCTWHLDEENSILRVTLKDGMELSKNAKEYLYVMMERDDIAVITSGLYQHDITHDCWNRDRMAHELGADRYHSFRRFAYVVNQATGFKEYQEIQKDVTMTIGDYFAYLKQRGRGYTVKEASDNAEVEEKLYLINSEGGMEELDISETIYMLDFRMETQLPAAFDHFMNKFLFPEILPGGGMCAMHTVPRTARPDMGPNLYVTPPGAFTHFHQDGKQKML
jgi:Helicase associated domain